MIGPLLAPAGTTAVTCVAELTVNDAAAVPLNETPVAPDKSVPVSTTEVPTAPLVGANPVIVGAAKAAIATCRRSACPNVGRPRTGEPGSVSPDAEAFGSTPITAAKKRTPIRDLGTPSLPHTTDTIPRPSVFPKLVSGPATRWRRENTKGELPK